MALFFSIDSQQIHIMLHASDPDSDPEPEEEEIEDALDETIEAQEEMETSS